MDEPGSRDSIALTALTDGEHLAPWEVDEMLDDHQVFVERRFLTQLRKFSQLAKRIHNIDMFSHFERLYEDTPGSDSLYVGVHELCSLLRKKPCNPTAHRDCEARQLLTAFHEMKVAGARRMIAYAACAAPGTHTRYAHVQFVLMAGRCQKHKPIADDLTEYPARVFAVDVVRACL